LGEVLVLGRDMDEEGKNAGPEALVLLRRAIVHQQETGDTIVVAPGFSPDFPDQSESYASMLTRELHKMGCQDMIVLESATFNTYGELSVFYQELKDGSVIGFDWHLKRVRYTAWLWIDRDWANQLNWIGVPAPMGWFDRLTEPLKWFSASLSPTLQPKMVALYKRFVSKRTSS
jgi:hypothetical protein